MLRRLTFTIFALAGLAASATVVRGGTQQDEWPPPSLDPSSVFNQDLFFLPDSASTADSLRALHLPPPHPMEQGRDVDSAYVYVFGQVLEMGPILKSRYPELFRAGSDRPSSFYWGWSALTVEVTEVLAGSLQADTLDVIGRIRSDVHPESPGWREPLIMTGTEFAGLLLMPPHSIVADFPLLHGSSVFVFSNPRCADRLDDYRPIVLDLFRRSAAAMAAAQ